MQNNVFSSQQSLLTELERTVGVGQPDDEAESQPLKQQGLLLSERFKTIKVAAHT